MKPITNALLTDGVRQLLLKYDPIFAVGNVTKQQDEYDLEIPEVIEVLMRCNSFRDLRKELRQIFSRTVGMHAGTRFRYTGLARDLLLLRMRILAEPSKIEGSVLLHNGR
jgi:hypothetical protein